MKVYYHNITISEKPIGVYECTNKTITALT